MRDGYVYGCVHEDGRRSLITYLCQQIAKSFESSMPCHFPPPHYYSSAIFASLYVPLLTHSLSLSPFPFIVILVPPARLPLVGDRLYTTEE